MSRPVRITGKIRVCLFICLLFTDGASAHADDRGRRPGASDQGRDGSTGRITGRVLRAWGSPMEARVIHVNGHRAATRKDGAFDIGGVSGTYDLWIEHDREERVTVYRGLTRRNPLLEHEGSTNIPSDRHWNKASISGIVRGDLSFPIEKDQRLSFLFMAETAAGGWGMGSRMGQDGNLGPRFGRMTIGWEGKPTLAGTLIAIGSKMKKDNLWLDPVLGVQPVVVNDKAETTVELTLIHLSTGRIAGEIRPTGGYRSWNGYLDFRPDGGRGSIDLGCRLDDAWRSQGRFDCLVPDLSVLHGQYCMSLIDGTAHGSTLEHCGGTIGMTDFSPTFQPPPELHALDKPGLVNTKTVLAWSGEAKAVYAVDVHWSYDGESSADNDGKGVDLRLYTTGTRLAWKDLERYGVKTPPGRKYEVTVSRMFPYRTVDEIASGSGPLSHTADYQRATSTPIEVKVVE